MEKSINNTLVCTPFKQGYNKSKLQGHVSLLSNKTDLEQLEVLVGCTITENGVVIAEFMVGDSVYVRGDRFTTPWAKTVHTSPNMYDFDKTKTPLEKYPVQFILVPYAEVVMHNDGEES
jgi:hypothetical protein